MANASGDPLQHEEGSLPLLETHGLSPSQCFHCPSNPYTHQIAEYISPDCTEYGNDQPFIYLEYMNGAVGDLGDYNVSSVHTESLMDPALDTIQEQRQQEELSLEQIFN